MEKPGKAAAGAALAVGLVANAAPAGAQEHNTEPVVPVDGTPSNELVLDATDITPDLPADPSETVITVEKPAPLVETFTQGNPSLEKIEEEDKPVKFIIHDVEIQARGPAGHKVLIATLNFEAGYGGNYAASLSGSNNDSPRTDTGVSARFDNGSGGTFMGLENEPNSKYGNKGGRIVVPADGGALEISVIFGKDIDPEDPRFEGGASFDSSIVMEQMIEDETPDKPTEVPEKTPGEPNRGTPEKTPGTDVGIPVVPDKKEPGTHLHVPELDKPVELALTGPPKSEDLVKGAGVAVVAGAVLTGASVALKREDELELVPVESDQ